MSFNPRAVSALLKLEIQEMFNAWEAQKPLRTGAPHASAILAPESEWCLRRQTLLALCPERAEHPETKPWDALKNAVFLHGWVLHEKYQGLFQRHGQVLEVETSHYDETRYLHFTPDAVISYGGQPYIVEIKGYKQETWEKLAENDDPPQAAWHQCNLYCHLMQIERGIVLIENKNTQEIKLWVIQHDAELARPYIDRMYAVKGSLARVRAGGGIPERACASKNENRAQKCPMATFCFGLL